MLPHFLSEYPSVTSPPTKFQKAISVYQRIDIKKNPVPVLSNLCRRNKSSKMKILNTSEFLSDISFDNVDNIVAKYYIAYRDTVIILL